METLTIRDSIIHDVDRSVEENCQWHNEIQSCIKEINDLIRNHEAKVLTEKEAEKSKEWNEKFQKGPKKGKSMWEKSMTFYCKPSIFKSASEVLSDLKLF